MVQGSECYIGNRFVYLCLGNCETHGARLQPLYIPIALHHVHGVLKPLSRKMRTTFTETVPLHDYC